MSKLCKRVGISKSGHYTWRAGHSPGVAGRTRPSSPRRAAKFTREAERPITTTATRGYTPSYALWEYAAEDGAESSEADA